MVEVIKHANKTCLEIWIDGIEDLLAICEAVEYYQQIQSSGRLKPIQEAVEQLAEAVSTKN